MTPIAHAARELIAADRTLDDALLAYILALANGTMGDAFNALSDAYVNARIERDKCADALAELVGRKA